MDSDSDSVDSVIIKITLPKECTYCHSKDHLLAKCPKLKSGICNYCKKKGHTIKKCPKLKNK